MYPSVSTIQTRLGISREKANQVRGLMDKSRIKTRSFESVRAWEAQCFNKPEWVERCLCAIDEVIGGFGVEGIDGNDFVSPFWRHERIAYVNMGDPYAPTVIYDTAREKFYVCSWGDHVETLERNTSWRCE